jgi:hypothetical protein
MADTIQIGQSVANITVDPSAAKDANAKLMSPNAKEDPETVTGDNPQKAWLGSGKMPKGDLGVMGRNF